MASRLEQLSGRPGRPPTNANDAYKTLRAADEAQGTAREQSLRLAAAKDFLSASEAVEDRNTKRALATIAASQMERYEKLVRRSQARSLRGGGGRAVGVTPGGPVPAPAEAASEKEQEKKPEPAVEEEEEEEEEEQEEEEQLRQRVAALTEGMASLEGELRVLGFHRSGSGGSAAPSLALSTVVNVGGETATTSERRTNLGESFMVVSDACRGAGRRGGGGGARHQSASPLSPLSPLSPVSSLDSPSSTSASASRLLPLEEAGAGRSGKVPDETQAQIVRLLQTINTLSDENHALVSAAEEKARLQAENQQLREGMAAFREAYRTRFSELKQALREFERLYPRGPDEQKQQDELQQQQRAEDSMASHSAARAAELQRTVHQLTAKLRQQAEANREKDVMIKRYSKWFNNLKTNAIAKQRRASSSSSSGGPAAAAAEGAPATVPPEVAAAAAAAAVKTARARAATPPRGRRTTPTGTPPRGAPSGTLRPREL